MEIVHLDTIQSDSNPLPHRHGGITLTYLLTGEENTPDNFSWTIGDETSSYFAPRHRHNFDQVRYCISGSIPIGKNLTVDEGAVISRKAYITARRKAARIARRWCCRSAGPAARAI